MGWDVQHAARCMRLEYDRNRYKHSISQNSQADKGISSEINTLA